MAINSSAVLTKVTADFNHKKAHMSGAYTHLAVTNDARPLAAKAGLRRNTLKALGLHLKYVELGAVSPDYPYLCLNRGQTVWADLMHYTNTAKLVRAAVAEVHKLSPDQQSQAMAWLFGFAAHITTDMTIHPVVELKVGPYKGNEAAHRLCEMHQDAYIFPRVLNAGATNLTEHLSTGIATCCDEHNEDRLNPAVELVWLAMLREAYPDRFEKEPPTPSAWHSGFKGILTTLSKANHLFPFSRHVSAKAGVTYPSANEVDSQYIQKLATPEGPKNFDEIYMRARDNVVAVWKGLDDALVNGKSAALDQLEDWNLDTGRSISTGKLVFWENSK